MDQIKLKEVNVFKKFNVREPTSEDLEPSDAGKIEKFKMDENWDRNPFLIKFISHAIFIIFFYCVVDDKLGALKDFIKSFVELFI